MATDGTHGGRLAITERLEPRLKTTVLQRAGRQHSVMTPVVPDVSVYLAPYAPAAAQPWSSRIV